MSDKDPTARVRAYLGDIPPLAGDPVTPENARFWGITGNIFTASDLKLDPAGPEIAALVALSKAIATLSRFQNWSGSYGVCERLMDDGDGEELGFTEGFNIDDWMDEAQRSAALRVGMHFHRVPRAYQSNIADVVTQLMLAMPNRHLPQPWAQCITYVVMAIAERVKANGQGWVDGQHRH